MNNVSHRNLISIIIIYPEKAIIKAITAIFLNVGILLCFFSILLIFGCKKNDALITEKQNKQPSSQISTITDASTAASTSSSQPLASIEIEPAPLPGRTFRDCPDCPEMVEIPPGQFLMGLDAVSQKSLPRGYNNRDQYTESQPAHIVTIGYGFAMGKYEVTQDEWTALMKENPSHFKGGRYPVDDVSYKDILNPNIS